MKNILVMMLLIFISGCSLGLEDVRLRENACKTEGGIVKRLFLGSTKQIKSIYCDVDGVRYYVNGQGKLL